jgi:hypothetical protein
MEHRAPEAGAVAPRQAPGQLVQIDHAAYPEALREKSDAALQYIMRDASSAMRANPFGEKAGYYADEVHYANMELRRRRGQS